MFRQPRRTFAHRREDRWRSLAGWEVGSSPRKTIGHPLTHRGTTGPLMAGPAPVVSVFGTASTSTDPYSDRIGNDGRAYLQDLSILNATDSSADEFRPTVQDLVRRQLKGQWRILRKNVHEERSGPRMSRYGPVMEGNVGEGQTVQSMDDRMPNQIWESTLSHIGPYSQIGSGMTDEPPPPYRSQKGSEDLSQSSSIYSQQRLQSQYESYQRWDTTPSAILPAILYVYTSLIFYLISHHRRLHPQQCMSHQITLL